MFGSCSIACLPTAVRLLVSLRAWRPNGWSSASIEQLELNRQSRRWHDPSGRRARRSHERGVPSRFRRSRDCTAYEPPSRSRAYIAQRCTQASRGKRRLAAGVTSTDHDHVEPTHAVVISFADAEPREDVIAARLRACGGPRSRRDAARASEDRRAQIPRKSLRSLRPRYARGLKASRARCTSADVPQFADRGRSRIRLRIKRAQVRSPREARRDPHPFVADNREIRSHPEMRCRSCSTTISLFVAITYWPIMSWSHCVSGWRAVDDDQHEVRRAPALARRERPLPPRPDPSVWRKPAVSTSVTAMPVDVHAFPSRDRASCPGWTSRSRARLLQAR